MASGAQVMIECVFASLGHCKILKDTKCSEKCKFRKTEEQYFKDQDRAYEILKARGLIRAIIQTEKGEIVTTKEFDYDQQT